MPAFKFVTFFRSFGVIPAKNSLQGSRAAPVNIPSLNFSRDPA
jgi:hypothetical protein